MADIWTRPKMVQHEALSILAALPGCMPLKPMRDEGLLPVWTCGFDDAAALASFLRELRSPMDVDRACQIAVSESWWMRAAKP